MDNLPVMMITGTSRGIGRYLAEYYSQKGYQVVGCSRQMPDYEIPNYRHYCLSVSDETKVVEMFSDVRRLYGRLDVLINNAGIASMNHVLLTPMQTVKNIYETNVIAAYLFCREAAKLMQKKRFGRIVNFTTVASALKLEGEVAYASSKTAVASLTQIFAKEVADYGITVNAIGPTPIRTDLIKSVPQEKIDSLIKRQAIKRYGEFRDISNLIDFFIKPESDFISAQVVYLGGIS
jgi:3-oxoacyl-[acyl-carrier protein] reductase